jgi:hypothetical protein
MDQGKESRCEKCAIRRKAEEKPRSLIGILWKLHTYICPGWRAYQRSLNQANALK